MNRLQIKTKLKKILKKTYAPAWRRETKRTADLYETLDTDVRQISAKGSPTVQKWINKRISGSESIDFVDLVKKKYIPDTMGRVAALGSHHAYFERELSRRGLAKEIDCYELSPGAIAQARVLCEESGVKGLTFYERDLNRSEFERTDYDAFVAVKSLHHVENLELLFEKVCKSLKPGGYFLIDDYFGPKRLQWTKEQLRIINDIQNLLPPELRLDRSSYKPKLVEERHRLSVEANIQIDPSEAVRSDETLGLLHRYFDVLEVLPYGGNIYLNLFSKIMGNFREDHPLGETLIKMILYIEDLALESGTLKDSDFKYVIARRKPD